MEFLHLCEAGEGDWPNNVKPLVKLRLKEEKGKSKEKKTTIRLFETENIARQLATLPGTPTLKNDISIQVNIKLEATTPAELEYGLDNGYVAARIHAAGNYEQLVKEVMRKFASSCFNHGYSIMDPEDEQSRKLALIKEELKEIIKTEQEAAATRAEACAKEEFGLGARITSTRRWQKVEIAFSFVKVGIGVFAVVAATTATLGVGLLAGHSLAKSIMTTGNQCYSFCNGFEENMQMLTRDVRYIEGRVNNMGKDTANIVSHIAASFLGDIAQPWNRVGDYSKNATLSLDEMRLKAQKMSGDLEKLLDLGGRFTQQIQIVKDNIATLEADPATNLEKVGILKQQIASIEKYLESHESTVDIAITGSSKFGGLIQTCESRLHEIKDKLGTFDASKGAKEIMALWSVLDFAGGIIAGGAAGDANILKGLNPINSADWVTGSNFASYIGNLSDAKDIVKNIKETVNMK